MCMSLEIVPPVLPSNCKPIDTSQTVYRPSERPSGGLIVGAYNAQGV